MIVPIVLWKINISTHRTLDSVAVDHAAVYDWMIFMRFHRVYQMLLGRPCQLLRRSFFFLSSALLIPLPLQVPSDCSADWIAPNSCLLAFVYQHCRLFRYRRYRERERLRACKDHGAHNVPYHRPNPNTHPDTTYTHPSPFSTCLY